MLASHYDPAHGDRPGGGLGIQSGSSNHAIRSPLEHQPLSTLSISITVNGIWHCKPSILHPCSDRIYKVADGSNDPSADYAKPMACSVRIYSHLDDEVLIKPPGFSLIGRSDLVDLEYLSPLFWNIGHTDYTEDVTYN